MKIAVFGLGKLGLPLLCVLAKSGHKVIGVDVDETTVDRLNRGEFATSEPDVTDGIAGSRVNWTATTDGITAASDAEAIFIVTPTPSAGDGSFSAEYILAACRQIRQGVSQDTGRKLIVITSTLSPGTMDAVVSPVLAGQDVCYSPEFIALGSVVQNLREPSFILIGESGVSAGDRLERLRLGLCCNAPPVARMNFVSAEIAKLSVNTFITTKISYANMIDELCESIPSANASDVTGAVGMDSRIGPKCLTPATGYGGPCFPRDNAALVAAGKSAGVSVDLAEATDRINERQAGRLARKVHGHVAVLGLAYKPGTFLAEKSAGVLLVNELAPTGIQVAVYDPLAMDDARTRIYQSGTVLFADSIEGCLAGADTVVIATPWPEFRDITIPDSCTTVLDCWGILPKEPGDG